MTTRPSKARRIAYLTREWIHTYFWKREVHARTPYGFDLIAGSYAANRAMLTGQFEQDEVFIINEALQSSSLFVDIGANIGFYTCLALKSGVQTLAVEPKRSNVDLLCRNLDINGWIKGECEVYPYGLSDKPGLLKIYGATGTAASLLKGWAGHSELFSEIVPITTLDRICTSDLLNDKKVFVKLDVEGAEYSVLSGANKTLDFPGQIAWLVEICLNEYHPGGCNTNYLPTFELMWEHGYQAFTADSRRIQVSRNDVLSWVKSGECKLNAINFLFTKGQQTAAHVRETR
jgi:FkbM family methyltransferase